ncbi:hypothetical protein C8R46DRAFT_1357633 [Mycena filopes]|nr:hypothetical protein C8R46DRAFT_1357633 [Mycena filopes]
MLLLSVEEALCYGFFLCIFAVSVYTHLKVSRRTTHAIILFTIACAMFVVATWHFAISLYRTIRGFADITTHTTRTTTPSLVTPNARIAFLANPHSWHALMWDALYIVQCLLGDSVAIYRCWILWDRDLRIIAFSLLLLVTSAVSGSMSLWQLSTQDSYRTIFAPAVWGWIVAFYALGLAQNTITTGLMAFRLWLVGRRSQAYVYNAGRCQFYSTILLLVESAALYFVMQLVVFVALLLQSNVELVLLGSIPPVIGITFTIIIIRVAFRSQPRAESSAQTQSLNLRDLGITVEITQEVFAKHDSDAGDSPV